MLPAQRLGPRPRRARPGRRRRQQLRPPVVQRGPDAAVWLARPPPRRARPDGRGRPRRRRRHRPGVQPPDPAARQRARHPHPGALGPGRLRRPLRPAGDGDVAARRRRSTTACWRVLVEEGVRATILAPGQALAVRPLDGGDWVDVTDGSVATGVPHRWCHPDGRLDRPRLLRRRPVARPRLRPDRPVEPGPRRTGAGGRRPTARPSWWPPTARRSATTTAGPTAASPTPSPTRRRPSACEVLRLRRAARRGAADATRRGCG